MNEFSAGDYVVATKYEDGDPLDSWAVGFFTGMLEKTPPRFMVANADGVQYRRNGFRRAQRISARRGAWLVDRMPEIQSKARSEANDSPTNTVKHSVWWWVRQPMTDSSGSQLSGVMS